MKHQLIIFLLLALILLFVFDHPVQFHPTNWNSLVVELMMMMLMVMTMTKKKVNFRCRTNVQSHHQHHNHNRILLVLIIVIILHLHHCNHSPRPIILRLSLPILRAIPATEIITIQHSIVNSQDNNSNERKGRSRSSGGQKIAETDSKRTMGPSLDCVCEESCPTPA